MRITHRDGSDVDPVEYADQHSTPLPDPYRCDDPYCPSSGQGTHQHGTRPDGVRV